MKNFVKESWLAIVVLLGLAAFGYGSMHLMLFLGGY